TVTIVTEGLVDHSDSLGSAGRFGDGDVQWMTAGKGVQHAEMFPLLNQDEKNPFELFQIWLNLPKRSKKVPPHYKMLWAEDIPVIHQTDAEGKKTTVTVYAGTYEGNPAPTPNPDSWAADPANQVALWRFQLEPGATATIPALDESVPRKLFYYQGNSVVADGQTVQQQSIITVDSTRDVEIQNGAETSFLLLMQGKPINEPVATYGPFVANDGSELQALFQEYQRTQFGGWPWDNHDVVHGNEHKRFALHADGSREDR
ncbi:MAG TPA: pirin, partial [Cytophagales bacterium]|nr:pirin [Cytophagales bacterium]